MKTPDWNPKIPTITVNGSPVEDFAQDIARLERWYRECCYLNGLEVTWEPVSVRLKDPQGVRLYPE